MGGTPCWSSGRACGGRSSRNKIICCELTPIPMSHPPELLKAEKVESGVKLSLWAWEEGTVERKVVLVLLLLLTILVCYWLATNWINFPAVVSVLSSEWCPCPYFNPWALGCTFSSCPADERKQYSGWVGTRWPAKVNAPLCVSIWANTFHIGNFLFKMSFTKATGIPQLQSLPFFRIPLV